MKKAKHDRLKKAGWKVGSTAEFLGLTEEEAALIEMKLALAHSLRKHRDAQNLTQEQLARGVGVSRLAIHNVERGKAVPSVSLALRLARFFNVSVERIFTLEEPQ